MPNLKIHFHRGGIHLPELNLWLDPHESHMGPELVFVSHAHSDHTGHHREVILTGPTSRLMHARIGGEWKERILGYDAPISLDNGEIGCEITLLPAGHIFGSAMAWINAGRESLLYTGDFKLRPGLSAEACQPRPADILIMETTYGRPLYRFPPTDEVIKGIVRFCKEALHNEETPVLLGYSLGKSQEMLRGLSEAGLPVMLHSAVQRMTRIYEEFGHIFPAYEKFSAATARGKVVVCPPSVNNSAALRGIGPTRVAVLTGWAVDPGCRYRSQAHAAFPLSDHADFPDLIEMVRKVNPRKVYTLHGFAADFAQTLRDMGYDAQPLSQQDQLALGLDLSGSKPQSTSSSKPPARKTIESAHRQTGVDSFSEFASTCSKISATTKKLEKVAILSAYFKTAPQELLKYCAVWFTGHPFPPSAGKPLQLGWAVIRDSLCLVGGLDQSAFGQVYLKHSDLGETAAEMLRSCSEIPGAPSLAKILELFHQLYSARGPAAKTTLLVQALQQCDPTSAKFLVKILTGDLRIGLKEGLVEESVAAAFAIPVDQVKSANLLLGNVGETAMMAQAGKISQTSLQPFRPIKYMLASPEETAADIWARALSWDSAPHGAEGSLPGLGPPEIWLEDKYDGVRAQLHKVGSHVEIFSRDLKDITPAFVEIADLVRKLPFDFIADGEIVAMRGDEVLPFLQLQKRLGRREGDLFLQNEIPVQFVVFDLLWLNGESLLDEPLRERRSILDKLSPAPLVLAQVTSATSPDAIETAFAAARLRGNEGLVIKAPNSAYTPGRRGLSWLKLKKALATLDCVVVGVEYGHGKRKNVLSDYSFAVRDELTGELKVVGKAYTGLTDVEIAQLTAHFLSKVISQKGRFHAVEPDTVLEIAFDLIQPSDRHASGLAMRFPRIVRIRTDKSPDQIDTLARAKSLVGRTAVEA